MAPAIISYQRRWVPLRLQCCGERRHSEPAQHACAGAGVVSALGVERADAADGRRGGCGSPGFVRPPRQAHPREHRSRPQGPNPRGECLCDGWGCFRGLGNEPGPGAGARRLRQHRSRLASGRPDHSRTGRQRRGPAHRWAGRGRHRDLHFGGTATGTRATFSGSFRYGWATLLGVALAGGRAAEALPPAALRKCRGPLGFAIARRARPAGGSRNYAGTDTLGPNEGTRRVLRGGSSYNSAADGVRSAIRNQSAPGARLATVGFRCARRASAE